MPRLSLPILGLALLLAGQARAQGLAPAARMTERGNVMFEGTLGTSWSLGHGAPDGSTTPFYAEPTLLYFVYHGIGIGPQLGVQARTLRTNTGNVYGRERDVGVWGGLSAALELRMGPRASLLLLPGISYLRRWSVYQASASELTTPGLSLTSQIRQRWDRYCLRVTLAAPLMLHFSSWLGMGIGPEFWFDAQLRVRGRNQDYEPVGASELALLVFRGGAQQRFGLGVSSTLFASF